MNTLRWTLSAERDERHPLVLHARVGVMADHGTTLWAGYLTLTQGELDDLARRLNVGSCARCGDRDLDDDDLHNRHPQPGDPAEPLPPGVEGFALGGRQ